MRESKNLTFLAGAGCSVDPPSNLSTAKSMMKVIIEHSCPKSEIQNILNLNELRFEELVELFRDILDPNLTILDFYGTCKKPNCHHMFLAQMIKKGNFVMTTNFDSLIEHALIKLNIPKEDIIPVITKEDFEKYHNPSKIIEESKYPIYKIHGSVKNIISPKRSQDVKTSLISTLDALGSHKKGTNLLSVEYFKKPLMEKISENRSLVTIGYSGGDDFDIIPTLKTLKKIKNIYWINHKKDEYDCESIFEIDGTDDLVNSFEEIDKILINIKKEKFHTKIYKINIDTSFLISKLFDSRPELESEPFLITPKQWIKEKIKNPNSILKWGFVNKLYYRFEKFNESLRSSREMLKISKKKDHLFYISEACNNIGKVHMRLYEYEMAMKYYKKALINYTSLQYSEGIINIYNSIGLIYFEKGNYNKSIYFYMKALRIINKIIRKELISSTKTKISKSIALNNIAGVYNDQGNLELCLKNYEESFSIAEDIGNIMGMATALDNLGSVFHQNGHTQKAMECYSKANNIFKVIYDVRGIITCTNKIGKLYYDQGNLKKAKRIWIDNLGLAKMNDVIPSIINTSNNLANLFFKEGNNDDAMILLEQSLELSRKLDKSQSITYLINLGVIHASNGNYNFALEMVEEAFQISTELNHFKDIASCYNKKGIIYDLKGDSQTAITQYRKSLEIVQDNGYIEIEANCLNQIGVILAKEKDFDEAFNFFIKALEIAQKINNIHFLAPINENLGNLFYVKKDYRPASFYLNDAFNFYQKLNFVEKQEKCLRIIISTTIKLRSYNEALLKYNNLIEILCKLKKHSEIGKTYIEKAKIFNKLERFKLAILYFKKVLRFTEWINAETEADTYNNLGSIYLKLNNINKAIISLEDAIKRYKILKKFSILGMCLNTLGLIYLKRRNFNKAFEYINESLKVNIEINNHLEITSNYKLLGDMYLIKGEKENAENYYTKSLHQLELESSNDPKIKQKIKLLNQLIKKCKN